MVVAAALAAAPLTAIAQVAHLPAADAELRRQVTARFSVVPLAQGVALSGASLDRRFEIDNGVILASGVPLSGDELRRRLGTDAAVVLRLSYLDNAALKRLFAPPPTLPTAPEPHVAPMVPPAPAPAAAASPTPPAPPPTPTRPAVFDRPSPGDAERVYRRTGVRLAFGKSIVVAEDEDVTESVFAVGGAVRIDGRVRNDVVVIGGNLDLSPTAEVRGDITVVGGRVTLAPGARHSGEVHNDIGRRLGGWSWPTVGWSRFDVGPAARWLALAGTLTRVMLLALAVAFVTFAARGRVMRIGAAATATPIHAGLVGLATQVLFVPALVVLAIVMAITIVGLPFIAVVIPLLVVLMFAAMVLGFTSLAATVGQAIGRRAGWATGTAVGAAVLGLAVIVLPTVLSRLMGMAPDSARVGALVLLGLGTAVEYVAWTVGLGAAVMTGLGKWAVVPPPLPSTPHEAAPVVL